MNRLTGARRRAWVLHQLGGPPAAHHAAVALPLTGPVDPVALAGTVRDVIARHDVLHSVVVEDADGEPHSLVVPVFRLRLPVVEGPAAVAHVIDCPFELAAEIPVRARLVRHTPDEHELVLIAHRVAADETFLAQVADEILTGDPQPDRPVPAELDPTPAPIPLPADRPRPALPCLAGNTVHFTLGHDLAAHVERLADRNGATVPTVLRAALAVLLHRLGSGTDIPIGTPEPGFVRAHHIELAGHPSFTEVLRKDVTTDVPACQVVLNCPTTKARPIPTRTARCDLEFTVTETTGAVRYATDLFDHDTVVTLALRFVRLLRALVTEPDRPVSVVDVLLPAERRDWAAFNRTAAPFPALTIPRLLHRQAETTPDAVALICGEKSLTYRELDEQATALAHTLAARGAGPETLVALALPRTPGLVISMLAIWQAGAAYLPIDPRYPSHRLAHILDQARPQLVLTDTETAPTLPLAADAPCLHLDTLPPADAPLTEARPDDLAYVMYTSGSTGVPKGVGVTHADVVNGITQLRPVAGIEPGGLVLASTSINFDVSVFEIVTSLSVGATVELVRDILHLAESPAWQGSVLHTVPSLYTELLRTGTRVTVDTALFAGEHLPADLIARIRDQSPDTTIVNAYGQTESFYATTHTLAAGSGAGAPIGVPLGNMRAYVLGPGLTPVPPGVVGELYVAGLIARGYHGQPGLTAQRFLPDPYGPPGSRMYRTGDLACLREGHLHYAGRNDTQVKLHGQRIEPVEIEQVLTTHPDITHAAVTLHERIRLVAYVVPATPDAELDPRRLRRYVADRLPAFMIPARFVVLDRLPLAPNGKLDVRALPAPTVDRRGEPEPPGEPEQRIAELFARALGRDRVSVDDDFFALGGDSVCAIALVRRIQVELDVPLTDSAFFLVPTVTGVAEYLGRIHSRRAVPLAGQHATLAHGRRRPR